MERAGLATAGFAGLAGTTSAGLWWQLFRRPLPRTKGRVAVEGLDGPIEISRDRWGVAHVRAEDDRDVWFGQGFCHGQDRLWQLDLYRRLACGRLAEIAGAQGLATDRLVRMLGLRRAAVREAEAFDPVRRPYFEAFCAGVNAAAACQRALPAEFQLLRLRFEPWTVADALTIAKLLSFGLSTNWERELLRAEMVRELGVKRAAQLDPVYPQGHPVALAPGESGRGDGVAIVGQIDRVRESLGLAVEAGGSNNWAISGDRSVTGGPLIAGDPHLSPSMPGITYQVGLYRGERLCRGASFPGLPGVIVGQNNDVVWTNTNVCADVMDLFIERIDGDAYEFEGERRPLTVIEEEISVKGRSEPERLVVRETHHGPIVNEPLRADQAEPLALRFSGVDFPGITAANFSVLDVTSGPELAQALADHAHPVSNTVWADRHGSIGYQMIGRLPVRRGDSPDLPKPGWTARHEWDGWVPYEEMPRITDPEGGFLVTANNRIAPPDYPHHVTSEYRDGYRAMRIEQLILSQPQHDLDSFQAMQTDVLSLPGLDTMHRLARLRPSGQRESAAIERLRSWNGRMDTDSVPAAIYQAFTLRFAREVARSALGDRDLAERWLDRADNGFIDHVTSPWRWQAHLLRLWREGDTELVGRPWDELALDALRGALDDLGAELGPDQDSWRWGRLHRLDFPHALGKANPVLGRMFNRTLEVGGGQETVAQVGWNASDPFRAIWAPCWRMVADPRNPDSARWQQFTGQSGHAGSAHYDDLQPRWKEGLMQSMAGEGPWQTLRLEPVNGHPRPKT